MERKARLLDQTVATVGIIVFLSLVNGCKSDSLGSNKPNEIRIGVLAPLTGTGAAFGQSEKEGVTLAVNEINARGGIDGKKIILRFEDTKTEPPVAVTAANKLLNEGVYTAVIGSGASLDVPAYMGLLEKAKVPHIVAGAVLPKITEEGAKWTFRNALNDKLAAQKMARFVATTLRPKRIALLLEDSAFGQTGEEFGHEITKLGISLLTTEHFRRGELDFSAQLNRIKALGVTHVQFWGYPADYAQIARQMKQVGLKAQLMGNQAPVNEKTIELGGQNLEGAINICLFVPSKKTEKARLFTDAYQKAYSRSPDTWAAQSYDGMMLLANALRGAGSDSERIRATLAATKDFPGVTGTITFLPNGDADFKDTSIVTVRNGAWVPYQQ